MKTVSVIDSGALCADDGGLNSLIENFSTQCIELAGPFGLTHGRSVTLGANAEEIDAAGE
ncbi:MAG: hypothetical protein FD180_1035 [Planctomycetota bacterium]|nr:MAG: hypothetical protein FD180_1035 [Planctomycetota bacterium]